jgi:hypothetical protein
MTILKEFYGSGRKNHPFFTTEISPYIEVLKKYPFSVKI